MPRVFGFGSLVNRRTLPDTLAIEPGSLTGWRRAWRATFAAPEGGVCSLSVEPHRGSVIEGLLITVSDTVWPGILAREARYDPVPIDGGVVFRAGAAIDRYGDAASPIRLSYVDCIVQGYFREFGEAGVVRFFDTTAGWHVPIVDDRADPLYPRAQRLTEPERAMVDAQLERVGATIEARAAWQDAAGTG